MKLPSFKSLLVMAAVGLVSYVIGLNQGFGEGSAWASYSSSSDAMETALVLKSLNYGEPTIETTKKLLEGQLNIHLLNNSQKTKPSPLILFSWIFRNHDETIDSLAARGARYRLDHPYTYPDPEVERIVEEVARSLVERYPPEEE